MDFKNIISLLKESKYLEYGKHNLLINLSCVYENQQTLEDTDWESDFEIIFAVPIDWLVDYKTKTDKEKIWSEVSVRSWLERYYTSEDSQDILEKAVLENKVAFYSANEKPILPF